MKKNVSFLPLYTMAVLASAASLMTSCSTNDGEGYIGGAVLDSTVASAETAPGGGGNGNSQAGVVTAGEWCDLAHWDFWSGLMLGKEHADKSDYWACHTNHRVPVVVTDDQGRPLAGLPVKLLRDDATLWEAVTDNHGQAELWVSPWQKSEQAPAVRISIDGQLMEQPPVVCGWDSLAPAAANRYALSLDATVPRQQADIAFVVDATGSMADEISFLKSDLLDIMGKVSALRPEQTLRTATLFYRDEGDEYLTRHSNFTTDAAATADFIRAQDANGGGDNPEAVHTALERMLQDLSWSSEARTRLAFLILDAPAHHEAGVVSSLQQSLAACARQGIRLIPIAASGVDKNTEFMLRFFAALTGGTYVFITNDSGVGLDHIEASVGDYEVEQLNELIIRLISQFTE